MAELRVERVVSELSEGEAATLAEMCRDLEVDPEDWPMVPALRTAFVHVAGARRVRRIMDVEGLARTPATLRAAVSLGIEPKALESALRRIRKATATAA